MIINNLNPVAFEIFFLKIHWYSLAYIFGIICGWIYIKKILLNDDKVKICIDDLITYLILGIIIGGRLGYVFIYNFNFYLSNPLEILMLWHGGMSFHGGLIGIIVSTLIFCKKKDLEKYLYLDLIAVAAPIGIFFGRIANFINSELVGKQTDLVWGVIFPLIDSTPRHPSQLYEAILEGVLLFIIMNIIYFSKNYKMGDCSFKFLIFYGIFRIFSEFFREPDEQIGFLIGSFSMGMMLSILMIFVGVVLYRIK